MSKMHEMQHQLCVHLLERPPPVWQDHCLGISCLPRTADSHQPCCSKTQTELPLMRTWLGIVGDTVYFCAALCSPVSFRSLACLQSAIHCKIVSSKEWKATPFLRGRNILNCHDHTSENCEPEAEEKTSKRREADKEGQEQKDLFSQNDLWYFHLWRKAIHWKLFFSLTL